jgi:hypothetical protein
MDQQHGSAAWSRDLSGHGWPRRFTATSASFFMSGCDESLSYHPNWERSVARCHDIFHEARSARAIYGLLHDLGLQDHEESLADGEALRELRTVVLLADETQQQRN